MRPIESMGPHAVLDARRRRCATSSPSRVGDEVAASIRTGLALDRVPLGAVGDGPWAMLDSGGALLAVYEATGTDRIRPAVVMVVD